jgi:hypothetical protein
MEKLASFTFASKSSAPTTATVAAGSETEILLDFLLAYGFDSRIGLLCCAPSMIRNVPCLLVSMRLTAWLASAAGSKVPIALALRRTDFRKGQAGFESLRALEVNFFPYDLSVEIKRLVPLLLPLNSLGPMSAADIKKDIKVLDAEVVGRYWLEKNGSSSTSAIELKSMVRKLKCRALLGKPKPGYPKAEGEGLRLGSPLAQGYIDEKALLVLMTSAGRMGHKACEHVGLGWRSAGSRLRSLEEIQHDKDFGFDVAAAEVAAGVAIPLPDIHLESGVFISLSENCDDEALLLATGWRRLTLNTIHCPELEILREGARSRREASLSSGIS